MVQAPLQKLSLDSFLEMLETKPASEYIDGQIIQKPMPKGKHSRLQGKLTLFINGSLEAERIAYAFPELRCTFGGSSIVPDVSVFLWQNIPTDQNGDIADIFDRHPDWMIEVLSPGQSQMKVTKKVLRCLSYGTQMGWLIDPKERSLVAYPLGKQPRYLEDEQDALPMPQFARSLNLTLGDILAWLRL